MGGEPRISRRAILAGSAGLCATAAGWAQPGGDTPPMPPLPAPPGGYRAEAARLTGKMMVTFWDRRTRQFRAPVRSAESVDSDPAHNNGYTVWPCIVALQALADAERVRRGEYRDRIAEVFDGLEDYWDPDRHAYTAWLRFPGNDDAYYDDNAWMVIALCTAFEATHESRYLDRAADIQRVFMPTGRDGSGEPGGMRWGVSPRVRGTSDRTACATSGAAAGALALARHGVDRYANVRLARELLQWVRDKLVDTDGLVRDGLAAPDWRIMDTKWTYNTGVTLRAWTDHYLLTRERGSLSEARRLASAATDRTKRLYDGLVRDAARTFWYDSSFFVQTLVDALMQLSVVTGDRSYAQECRRNANYAYGYLRDPADGLYWRNWRLWTIGEAQLAAWEGLTGQSFHLEPDESERSKTPEAEKLPVASRPLVKTLLANAGMARLFWRMA